MTAKLVLLPSVLRPQRPTRRIEPVAYPMGAELMYVATLHHLATDITEQVRAKTLPKIPGLLTSTGKQLPRMDDRGTERFASFMADLSGAFGIATKTARKAAQKMIAMVSGQHAVEFGDKYRGLIRVNPMVGDESWLPHAMELATQQNVALIQSIPSQFRKEAERIITDGVMGQKRHEAIASELIQRCGVMESRAMLIARDQVGSWHGSLQRLRQIDAGVVSYDWSTSRDERVRRSHQLREGRRYRWDTPPSGGDHPGMEVGCRCVATPHLEDDEPEAVEQAAEGPMGAIESIWHWAKR